MKHLTTFCVVTSLLLAYIEAYSCKCPEKCPELNCPGGKVEPSCGCCLVCAKQLGETCEGRWRGAGRCDDHLFCYLPADISNKDGNVTGICREINPDCSGVTCNNEIEEPCPFASTRHYRMLEPGKCCPRASECKCDDVCPPKPVCPHGQRAVLMSKGTGRLDACCDFYECKPNEFTCDEKICPDWYCPSDSKQDYDLNQGEACCPSPSERKCICDPNNWMLCPSKDLKCKRPNEIYTTHRRISGTPGQCCNKKQCLSEKPEYLGCLVENRTLEHGEAYDSFEECASNLCTDGLLEKIPYECPTEPTCKTQLDIKCCDRCTNPSPLKLAEDNTDYNIMISVCSDPYTNEFFDIGEMRLMEDDNNCTQCECIDGGVWHCKAAFCDHKPDIIALPGNRKQKQPILIDTIDENLGCPVHKRCTLKCPRGFETDKNGCEKCICKRRKRLCRTKDTTCMKDCPYGFKKSKNCQRCKCLACPKVYCAKPCTFGYQRNEFGCMTCKCDEMNIKSPSHRKSAECRDEITDELRSEGERWKRGCLNCTCGGGEIYCEIIKCAIPQCQHPIFTDGHCCPYCPEILDEANALPAIPEALDCYTEEGNWNEEGSTWKINGGCTTCLCYQGKVTCTSTKCRPLACKITIQVEGECCRKCADETPLMSAQDLIQLAQSRNREELYCLDSNLIRRNWGEQWHEDRCTSCVCISGIKRCYTSQCESKLPCANPVLLPDECCPRCIQTSSDYHVNTCQIRNKIKTTTRRKKSDESGLMVTVNMQVDQADCLNCTCQMGRPKCVALECPPQEPCPDGNWIDDDFTCCPRCERTKPITTTTTIVPTTTTSTTTTSTTTTTATTTSTIPSTTTTSTKATTTTASTTTRSTTTEKTTESSVFEVLTTTSTVGTPVTNDLEEPSEDLPVSTTEENTSEAVDDFLIPLEPTTEKVKSTTAKIYTTTSKEDSYVEDNGFSQKSPNFEQKSSKPKDKSTEVLDDNNLHWIESNPVLLSICSGILLTVVIIVLYLLWLKRKEKRHIKRRRKDTIDRYPNVKPQLVEPVSCL